MKDTSRTEEQKVGEVSPETVREVKNEGRKAFTLAAIFLVAALIVGGIDLFYARNAGLEWVAFVLVAVVSAYVVRGLFKYAAPRQEARELEDHEAERA